MDKHTCTHPHIHIHEIQHPFYMGAKKKYKNKSSGNKSSNMQFDMAVKTKYLLPLNKVNIYD